MLMEGPAPQSLYSSDCTGKSFCKKSVAELLIVSLKRCTIEFQKGHRKQEVSIASQD
jgi:hypothetical protein